MLQPEFHRVPEARIAKVRAAVDRNVEVLLTHRYFTACRTGDISGEQILKVVEQLYCFSVFFERIITKRVAMYTSGRNQDLIDVARHHLREEIGHADLFKKCLVQNGMSREQVRNLAPKMFTKAMFGYLLATIDYESELVGNIAIMQVMETIGAHFFATTLGVMREHNLDAEAFVEHANDDLEHANLGLDLCAQLDEQELADSLRVINDCFRLMGFVLDEWLGQAPVSR